MALYAYQRALVDRVYAAWAAGSRSVVLQLGTGGGKTHTAASILREETGPVVFAAHLDSLVGDTAKRLRGAGTPCGIVAPGAPPTVGFPPRAGDRGSGGQGGRLANRDCR